MELSEKILQQASLLMTDLFGLNFPPNRWRDMERGLKAAASQSGHGNSPEDIARWISKGQLSQMEVEILVNQLTVGETYFFREEDALQLFQQKILPAYINLCQVKPRTLKIWSAGCCTGEEPYTLAILLREKVPEILRDSITILATDINPAYLAKAKAGIYGKWSFRNTPEDLQKKYFRSNGSKREIVDVIKMMVQFEQHNLASNIMPSATPETKGMDVIFCRNVLMYFTPEVIRKVASGFYNALQDGGWLITSPVELNDDYFGDFSRIQSGNGIFYRKLSLPEIKSAEIPQSPASTQAVKNSLGRKSGHTLEMKQRASPEPIQLPLVQLSDLQTDNEVAAILYKGAKYKECVEKCQQILLKNKSDKVALNLLTKVYADSGKYEQAKQWAIKLLAADRLNPESYYLYATILFELQEYLMVTDILKKGLYLSQDHLLMHILIGNAYKRKGKEILAKKHFKNAAMMLNNRHFEEVVENSGGLTVGRINELIQSLIV